MFYVTSAFTCVHSELLCRGLLSSSFCFCTHVAVTLIRFCKASISSGHNKNEGKGHSF